MPHERSSPFSAARRCPSASVALVVCTVTTVTVLLIDPSGPALAVLISVAAALGSYWWMVIAETRRPSLTLRAVVLSLAVVFGAALTTAPRETGDVWSYAIYGRMVAVRHASPYRHFPDEYSQDPMFPFVAPTWRHTGSVYGPAFTAFSAAIAPLAGDSGVRTRVLYQATAALAVAGALMLLWRRTRSPAALAWLGLQPVVALQLVNGGRNDALIGLGILAAILLAERAHLRASGLVTGAAAAIKATGLLTGAGLAIWTWRRGGIRRAAVLVVATGATLAGAYALAGGTAALGPLEHASTQLSQASIWEALPALGVPIVSSTVAMVVTAVVVGVCLCRQTKDDPAQAGLAGPAAFLLAAPYVLPGYLGWVLPGAALHHRHPTSRIMALQATLLVGAYMVFRHPPPGPIGETLVTTTELLASLLGVILLVAFLIQPRRRSPEPREFPGTPTRTVAEM